uniref:Uncharacterized protein n=1 Tax=Craspedostauros australis TaxID=1486917 RepID=A0A7R9WUN0_9STRA
MSVVSGARFIAQYNCCNGMQTPATTSPATNRQRPRWNTIVRASSCSRMLACSLKFDSLCLCLFLSRSSFISIHLLSSQLMLFASVSVVVEDSTRTHMRAHTLSRPF